MRLITTFGMIGGYFLAWQAFTAYKARLSAEKYEANEARHNKVDVLTRSQFLEERTNSLGAPQRLLNVNNFDLKTLNGEKAPMN